MIACVIIRMMQLSLAASKSVAIRGDAVRVNAAKPRAGAAGFTVFANADADRLRLHNLSPLEGSRRTKKRVGRGYGAGQGGSCGLGMVRVAGERRGCVAERFAGLFVSSRLSSRKALVWSL